MPIDIPLSDRAAERQLRLGDDAYCDWSEVALELAAAFSELELGGRASGLAVDVVAGV